MRVSRKDQGVADLAVVEVVQDTVAICTVAVPSVLVRYAYGYIDLYGAARSQAVAQTYHIDCK